MNKVRPSRDLVLEMVEEWIETTEKLSCHAGRRGLNRPIAS